MAGFAEVLIEFLPKEKGGRRTPICLGTDASGRYRPHFRVRDGDGAMLGVEFVDGPDDPVLPGGSAYATVRFVYEPEVCYDALVVGAQFEVLEGSRVVAVGQVTRR
jgi:translation elongation factor EF-Tu-like GTPase